MTSPANTDFPFPNKSRVRCSEQQRTAPDHTWLINKDIYYFVSREVWRWDSSTWVTASAETSRPYFSYAAAPRTAPRSAIGWPPRPSVILRDEEGGAPICASIRPPNPVSQRLEPRLLSTLG